MPAGLAALALLAQASAPPAEVAKPGAAEAAVAAKADTDCTPGQHTGNPNEIVICAEKPQGYRIDPDVMKAKRQALGGGKPKRPERMVDNSCTVVGPAPCIGAAAGINLLAAAATAAEMAARLAEGKEIGSMFVTDPTPSEYQLYLEAKREREAKEEEKAAQALAAKAKAAAQAKAAQAESK